MRERGGVISSPSRFRRTSDRVTSDFRPRTATPWSSRQLFVLDFFYPMWVLRRWVFLLVLGSVAAAQSGKPSVKAGSPKNSPSRTTTASASLPNLILITLDTTRADRMGFLGSTRGLTPNLDELAKQGVVFTRSSSRVPLSPPSHATILTGTYTQFNHANDFGVRL